MKNPCLSLDCPVRCPYCGKESTGFTLEHAGATSGITVCTACGGIAVLDSTDKPLRVLNKAEREGLKDHSDAEAIRAYHDRIVGRLWG